VEMLPKAIAIVLAAWVLTTVLTCAMYPVWRCHIDPPLVILAQLAVQLAISFGFVLLFIRPNSETR
jgi:hypothetical protein